MMHARTKIISLISICFFVGSVVGFFGMVYMISAKQKSIEEYKLRIAERHSYEQELKSLSRLVEDSQNERDQISSYILEEEQVIDFLALLETLGRESGARVEASSLQVSPLKGSFEQLNLVVTVTGSYDAVVHILKELENLPYQSNMSDASVAREIGEGEIPYWKGEFTMHVTKYTKL